MRQHFLSKEIQSVYVPILRCSWAARTFPSLHLPVSFNKSICWQQGSGSVRGKGIHGIKVALLRTNSSKRTTKEKWGRNHGLDFLDSRNSYSFFGNLLPSSYLEITALNTRSHAQERNGNPCVPTPSSIFPSKPLIGGRSPRRILFASMAQGICIVGGVPITFDWFVRPRAK